MGLRKPSEWSSPVPLPTPSCVLCGREQVLGLNAVSVCVYVLTGVCKHVGKSMAFFGAVRRYLLVQMHLNLLEESV